MGVDRAILHRVLPFALFMTFIVVEECLHLIAQRQGLILTASTVQYLYAVKACSVAWLLYLLRAHYTELRFKDLLQLKVSAAAAAIGIVTFLVWIGLPATLPFIPPPKGYDPTLFTGESTRSLMIAVRVAGAVFVVPVMEELFWRSFLLRYLVAPDFQSVPLGRFTWGSFVISSVLFGLEHHLFLAGMLAGALFNLVLYRTRSLAQCVLAHSVANLALACWVLQTGDWRLW
ncbi:CAAX prenyl protease-related protein [Geomonas subterranea]|nr:MULTISPECIES: CAAX prenyl protease-related protein [Geomonas]